MKDDAVLHATEHTTSSSTRPLQLHLGQMRTCYIQGCAPIGVLAARVCAVRQKDIYTALDRAGREARVDRDGIDVARDAVHGAQIRDDTALTMAAAVVVAYRRQLFPLRGCCGRCSCDCRRRGGRGERTHRRYPATHAKASQGRSRDSCGGTSRSRKRVCSLHEWQRGCPCTTCTCRGHMGHPNPR